MATTSAASLPILILLGSLFNGSILGPPLELDPALSAIAPEKCILYASSAGVGEADPQSTNQTEQLLAEPEIQYFFQEVEKQIQVAISRIRGANAQQQVAAEEVPKVIKAFLTKPFALFIENVYVTNEGVNVQAGLVLNAGDQKESIENAVKSLLALKGEQGPPINNVDQNGQPWSSIQMGPQFPEIRWGWHEDYFVLAVGEGTADKIIERMQSSAPTWLTEIRSQHPLEREASLGYINVEMILERAKPFLILEDGWKYVEKLGLDSIKELHGIAGFDETGCVTASHLVTDGQRRGLLSLIPHKPISKRDLRVIPDDAMLAFAVRCDAKDFFEDVMRLIEEFDPQASNRLEEGMRQAESETGVHFKNDFLSTLGDAWIAYLPAGDLMTSWLGSAAAVRVKDSKALENSINTFVAEIQARVPRRGRGEVSIRDTEYQGYTIHTVDVVGEVFPIAPSWCVTDEWVVFGLMPQTVRTVITRELEDSLADREEVKEALAASDGPAVISYFDTPRLVQSIYPMLQIGGRVMSGELRKQGFDLDISMLPSQDAIVKHLRPGVGTITYKSDGFHFDSKNSLPGSGNAIAAAPMAVALLLPAVQGARDAARLAQEVNQLKQLALAFHNYESANRKLPTNIYDENGNALLSWRVQLLPYLEGNNLYGQFHLDEPWDSPHNLKIAKTVPELFVSPSTPEIAEEGKTRFVALAGEETLFPGNKKMTFAGVRDGLSNTLLYVHTAPSAAVPWTKPADIQYNAEKPLQGIRWAGKPIAIALSDGSCHRLPNDVDKEAFKAMVTPNGGEAVDVWSLLQN